jgi:hypothetical protein
MFFDQRIFSVFGVDFDVFSAFLIRIKKSLLSSGAMPPAIRSSAGRRGPSEGRKLDFPLRTIKILEI